MQRCITKHNEKFVEYTVRCVLKLLSTTNRVRHTNLSPKSNLEDFFIFFQQFLYCLDLTKIDITFLIYLKREEVSLVLFEM